jgi:hypothetical protein
MLVDLQELFLLHLRFEVSSFLFRPLLRVVGV